ncbi:MAG: hypothetical protein LBO80_12150 [Treponema sp.]|jgi:hypothetical protein|nr:hypothetical protein [Treponema sp.]
MSTGDPYVFDPRGFITALAAGMPGDAYWIVKPAFHPEWVKGFHGNG